MSREYMSFGLRVACAGVVWLMLAGLLTAVNALSVQSVFASRVLALVAFAAAGMVALGAVIEWWS